MTPKNPFSTSVQTSAHLGMAAWSAAVGLDIDKIHFRAGMTESPQPSRAAPAPYHHEMLTALVLADQDYEATGAVSCETMKLIRDLLTEMGVA